MKNQSSNKAIRVNQKNRKSSWEEYATWRCFNFWPIINIFQTRVWLWLVHKITEIHCRPQFFSEVIQTQKKYSTSFYKISILTRSGSRTAATSKLQVVNYYYKALHLVCCSSRRSASASLKTTCYIKTQFSFEVKSQRSSEVATRDVL